MQIEINIIMVLIYVAGLLPVVAVSQPGGNVKFDRLTSENIKIEKGLSQNWVYSILQDRYGYMWFGTWDGLNRYDGYNFITYNMENGLSDHTILSLLEDDEGYIWIGTDNGLNRFERKTGKFKQYLYNSDSSNCLVNNTVKDIIQTMDGKLWIGTAGGLSCFDKKTGKFESYFSRSQDFLSPRSNYIIDLYEDKKGIIWISTSFGLIKFDPLSRKSIRYYHIDDDSTTISHNNVRCVLQDSKGYYWVGTRFGLNIMDSTAHVLKQFFYDPGDDNSISDNWIRVIYEDSNGKIWIGTASGGLNLFDSNNNSFIRFKNSLNDPSSLSNDKIYSILEDRAGNLWVGTYKGVNKIGKYTNNFKHCYRSTNDNKSISDNIIWSFYEGPGDKLWIGTSNGVNVFDPANKTFEVINNDTLYDVEDKTFDVRSICYSPVDNCMWFGSFGNGLYRFSLENKEMKSYRYSPVKNGLPSDYLNVLLFDRKDNLMWIGTGNGLCRMKNGNFYTYKHSQDNGYSLSNNIIISMIDDDKDNLWIGTDNGLNRFDKKTKKFYRYFYDKTTKNSKGINSIFCIFQDSKGTLWLGTSGGGLIHFYPQTEKFEKYTTEDGLSNNIIYSILEDGNHNIWMSTNYGISKFDISDGRFVNYDVKDGLQSNEFNLGAAMLRKDGLMYFGGMNGYNVFDPLKIKENPEKPVVVVSLFRKFNEIVPGELFDGDTITLNYDDNYFSFEIAALDYTNPAKNKYKYKLENIDEDWVPADADNRWAEYKKVRPGNYIFKAMGSNNDGVWNEKGIKLTLIVKPPWWGTWYFRTFAAMVIIFSVWWVIYRRIRIIKRRHEMKMKLLEIEKQKFDLEQQALRLQINPHFIFNSLNSIQSYILKSDTGNAVFYLGKFSQLMRIILSNTTSNYVTLKDELTALRYYIDLEKLRFEGKFDYVIKVDPDIDEEFVEIPPMIIQPYVENAIIHGLINLDRKGNLHIEINQYDENSILCIVKDDGIGRERAAKLNEESGIKHKSRGMLITKARLEIQNRQSKNEFSVKIIDLRNEFGEPAGTEVRIVINFVEE